MDISQDDRPNGHFLLEARTFLVLSTTVVVQMFLTLNKREYFLSFGFFLTLPRVSQSDLKKTLTINGYKISGSHFST